MIVSIDIFHLYEQHHAVSDWSNMPNFCACENEFILTSPSCRLQVYQQMMMVCPVVSSLGLCNGLEPSSCRLASLRLRPNVLSISDLCLRQDFNNFVSLVC